MNIHLRTQLNDKIVIKQVIIVYFILSIIFIIAFWYYVTLFCIIYHNNQVNWIIDCVTGIGMSLLYSLGIATLISTMIYISLKVHSRNLYNIANYFNK